ncbi:MAG: methyltransferase domain-containing protein [Smithella sp.]
MISDDYKKQNQELHNRPNGFGGGGHKHLPEISRLVTDEGIETILDYGCGQASLSRHCQFNITNYDPCVDVYSNKPTSKFDLVVCTDVLEHVEPEHLKDVIDDVFNYANKCVYFCIACLPANKTLPDGRNAHLTQEQPDFWMDLLLPYIDNWMMLHNFQRFEISKEFSPNVKKFTLAFRKRVQK